MESACACGEREKRGGAGRGGGGELMHDGAMAGRAGGEGVNFSAMCARENGNGVGGHGRRRRLIGSSGLCVSSHREG